MFLFSFQSAEHLMHSGARPSEKLGLRTCFKSLIYEVQLRNRKYIFRLGNLFYLCFHYIVNLKYL